MSKEKINYRSLLIRIHIDEGEIGKISPIQLNNYGEIEVEIKDEDKLSIPKEILNKDIELINNHKLANSMVWIKDIEDDEIAIIGNSAFDEQIEELKKIILLRGIAEGAQVAEEAQERFNKSYEELKKFAYEHL